MDNDNGPIHEEQHEHDEDRDAILKHRGLAILRFQNEEIENDIEAVTTRIRAALLARDE